MAVKPIGTTQLTWGSIMGRGNREPLDDTQLNYSYADLLWELNQRTGNPSDASYTIGANKGGSGNFYVGLITSVPYVNDNVAYSYLKIANSHYTSYKDDKGNVKLAYEPIGMKGPWYVSYCGKDTRYGNKGVGKYGFKPDGNGNTYYADRIVLRQEMDYALDKDFVRKTQLGTYYTGVGLWYDSYTKSKEYGGGKECPDGTYFHTYSYAEIFNDYTHNIAIGNFSHSEGKQTKANGEGSHAEGYNTQVNALHGHAEGHSTIVSADDAHAEGTLTTASQTSAHAEGDSTTASGIGSHSEGTYTTASGKASHAEGTSSKSTNANAHSEGNTTTASGESSHSEGKSTIASGANAHAEGNTTTASGESSHAEGYNTKANALYGHAEGNSTVVSKNNAHAEGNTTTASGESSHSEGKSTIASGANAHSEGNTTTASGESSHSEGKSTIASGANAHSEGNTTTASGESSHSEGKSTIASGANAHAEGLNTKALNANEHAEGKFNVSDNTNYGGTLHTIGDGTADDKRHNIVAIYNDRTTNVENSNTTIHGSGYFKLNQDGNYTVTIGTIGKSNIYKRTIVGSEEKNVSGTSDRRVVGATYEGFGNLHTMTVHGFMSTYAYSGTYSSVKNNCYEYIMGEHGTYVKGKISQRSDTSVYLSSPKICVHGDPDTDDTYIDLSSNKTYLYGRTVTYIGQNIHDVNSKSSSIYIKGTTINHNSTNSNKTTYTSVNTITGSSTTTVTGNTSINTGSLNVTSGVTNFNLNKTHVHATNELCLKSTTDATIKGNTNTKVGQDYEGNLTENFLVTSTKTGTVTTPTLTTNASTIYTENAGQKVETITNSRTTTITGGDTLTVKTGGRKSEITDHNEHIVHGYETNTIGGKRTSTVDSEVITVNIGGRTTTITGGDTLTVKTGGRKTEVTDHNEHIVHGYEINTINGKRTSTVDSEAITVNKNGRTLTVSGLNHETFHSGNKEDIENGNTVNVSGGRTTTIKSGSDKLTITNGNLIIKTSTNGNFVEETATSTYINTNHTYFGNSNTINGNYSVGLGQGIKISSNHNVSIGKYNKDESSYFSIGIGTSDTIRKNAFWVAAYDNVNQNGTAYFSNTVYAFTNKYDPNVYTSNKEDKSWSNLISFDLYRNSYNKLYSTAIDKINSLTNNVVNVKSIDSISRDSVNNTLHWTTHTFNPNSREWSENTKNVLTIPGVNSTQAGLISADDKNRLDSIKGFTTSDGKTHQYTFNENHSKGDNIHSFHLNTDGTISYTGWTQQFHYANDATNVSLSYTHYVGNNSTIYIPKLNNGTTFEQVDNPAGDKAGIMTAAQYNNLIKRITLLEKQCIWKSSLANNNSTYMWSGTLSDFNNLESYPKDTTFIITN